jgi:hypothetical protein
MRKHVQEIIAIWNERLDQTPEGERAGLLEMLPSSLEPAFRKGIKR